LSVVVPSVNGLEDLTDCLGALAAQRDDCDLEVLVVDRCGEAVRRAVRMTFPWARLLETTHETAIPTMRARAFEAAHGEFVAVIEDHVIVPPGWANQLLAAAREAEQVVGGSVENAATEHVVDWAAFLCEYSQCMGPLPAGAAERLTGNNVIYPRVLLERYMPLIAAGGWENNLHDALRRDGVRLECRPEIQVGHKKHYTVAAYLSQRYLYARSYAGARVAGASMVRRLAYGFAAFALPPVLLFRTVSRVLSKRRHRGELVVSLPLLTLFVTSWAFGEVVGYWAGPGDSLARVC
jgi:glycosyltransferase involved in cell wall biosynthesis